MMRSLGQDAAKRIRDERPAPELKSNAGGAVTADVSMLVAHAVDRRDVHAVGDRVGALDGLPRIVLG